MDEVTSDVDVGWETAFERPHEQTLNSRSSQGPWAHTHGSRWGPAAGMPRPVLSPGLIRTGRRGASWSSVPGGV